MATHANDTHENSLTTPSPTILEPSRIVKGIPTVTARASGPVSTRQVGRRETFLSA
jgi:hypothetical protein